MAIAPATIKLELDTSGLRELLDLVRDLAESTTLNGESLMRLAERVEFVENRAQRQDTRITELAPGRLLDHLKSAHGHLAERVGACESAQAELAEDVSLLSGGFEALGHESQGIANLTAKVDVLAEREARCESTHLRVGKNTQEWRTMMAARVMALEEAAQPPRPPARASDEQVEAVRAVLEEHRDHPWTDERMVRIASEIARRMTDDVVEAEIHCAGCACPADPDSEAVLKQWATRDVYDALIKHLETKTGSLQWQTEVRAPGFREGAGWAIAQVRSQRP